MTWVSVSDTRKRQREAKLNSFIYFFLLPGHSTWCERLLLAGLFSCQMEAGDSCPRCACLVWRPDYHVHVTSWPVIKGTLTHITFQLLTLGSARRRSALKPFPASKPMFVIFFPLGQWCQEEQAPEPVRWREDGKRFLMVEDIWWRQSCCCAAAGGLQHGVFAKHEVLVGWSLLDGWDLILNNF